MSGTSLLVLSMAPEGRYDSGLQRLLTVCALQCRWQTLTKIPLLHLRVLDFLTISSEVLDIPYPDVVKGVARVAVNGGCYNMQVCLLVSCVVM